jgi:hypothetical protein
MGTLGVHPGHKIFMSEIWMAGGATRVHFSTRDNDDTIASYAEKN